VSTVASIRPNANDGRVDLCSTARSLASYQGPMSILTMRRRNGAPYINAQPRFGIYATGRGDPDDLFRQDHVSGMRTPRDTRTTGSTPMARSIPDARARCQKAIKSRRPMPP